MLLMMLHHAAGEVLVVDEADTLQAFQNVRHLVGVEPRAQEALLELATAPRSDRQEPECALVTCLRVLRL